MKGSVLIIIVVLAVLLGMKSRQPGPGKSAVVGAKGQTDYFRKLKPRFKYVNLTRFSNEKLGYQHEVKLQRMDSVTYRKLFRKSHIFTANNEGRTTSYYAYNKQPGYYQLVFTGDGRYVPSLVLCHFAPDGKLMTEQVVASSFFDAGQGQLTKSFLRNDSLLIRMDLELSERPPGTPCDSLVTTFKIAPNGTITRVRQKNFKIKCW